jgi:hypothetical protein
LLIIYLQPTSVYHPSTVRHHLIRTQDPNYATALARLPAYKASVEVRYPLVCRNCLPAVQERIKQKEHFARSQAFGGWLETNRSGQRSALNRVSSTIKRDREKPWEMWLWRVQGALYVLNTAWTVVSYLAGLLTCSHFVSATDSTF